MYLVVCPGGVMLMVKMRRLTDGRGEGIKAPRHQGIKQKRKRKVGGRLNGLEDEMNSHGFTGWTGYEFEEKRIGPGFRLRENDEGDAEYGNFVKLIMNIILVRIEKDGCLHDEKSGLKATRISVLR